MSGLSVMSLNDGKAGMSGLDKGRINAIIQEASKGSKFYAAKQRSQERIDGQVHKIKEQMKTISETQLDRANREMDLLAQEIQRHRDLSR